MSKPNNTHTESYTKIEAAVDYGARGIPVFPLNNLKDGLCTCGDVKCDEPGFHLRYWNAGAGTTEEHKVRELWSKSPDRNICPDGNIGISLGKIDQKTGAALVALHVVSAEGGLNSLAKLGIEHLSDTATVGYTIGGAEHRALLFWYCGEAEEMGVGVRFKTRNLGPGLTLLGFDPIGEVNYIPAPTPGDERGWWGRRLEDASIAFLPDQLLTAKPIPEDEDEFSRGCLHRVRMTPEQGEPPELLYHDLLLRRGVHAFLAEPGIGKSISALALAVSLIKAGEKVMYFDADGNGTRINHRLTSMGVEQEDLDTNFYYYSANGLSLEADAVSRFNGLVDLIRPTLVIFDNLTNLFSRAGVHENDNVAVTNWFNAYPAKVRDMGAAALILDHPAKAGRGRYARGGGSKLAEEDVAWSLTQPNEFNRDKVGSIKFKLEKDNEGAVPSKHLIYRVGGAPLVFEPTKAAKLTENQRAVLDTLVDGATSAEWLRAAKNEAGVKHNNSFYRAVDALVAAGFVEADEDQFYATG